MGQQIVTAQIAGGAGGLRKADISTVTVTDSNTATTIMGVAIYYASTAQTVSYRVTAGQANISKETSGGTVTAIATGANVGATGSVSLGAGDSLTVRRPTDGFVAVYIEQTA